MTTKVIERDQLGSNVGKRGKRILKENKTNSKQSDQIDILKEEVTAMTGADVSAMLG